MVGSTQHPVVTDTVETSGEEALETCCRVAQGVERHLLAGHERAETKVTVTVRGENAAETVEGVGHLVHMEATERFNGLAIDFLDSH